MAGAEVLEQAADALDRGLLVALPTDTVYGLAARADLPAAVNRIFELKERERDKPLPVLGSDALSLETIVRFDDRAAALARCFWPGPLTIVLPRAEGFDHDLGGTESSTSVAVRVPASDSTRALLAMTGPLAVTSANPSGAPPALTASEARAMFGDSVAVYLEEDTSGGGTSSTVVALMNDVAILREGPVSEEEIRQTLMS